MSKYKAGDKVVMEITGVSKYGECYEVAHTSMWNTIRTERVTEPLSTYTEPLEAKIRRQAAEITRLLRENKELKEDFEKSKRVNLNMGRVVGQNEAWNLARKIFDMETNDIEDIFITEDAWNLGTVLNNYTYPEAAAKVAEWEKAKEEIKVGDVYKNIAGSCFVICDVNEEDNNAQVLWSSSLSSRKTLDEITRYYTKTGRHIDVDSFLKQIRGEGDEK